MKCDARTGYVKAREKGAAIGQVRTGLIEHD